MYSWQKTGDLTNDFLFSFEDLGFEPEYLGPEEEQKTNVRQKLLATAKKAARQVPFMEDVVAGYYCALDPATPAKVRATLLAALAYFVFRSTRSRIS